MTYAIGAIVTVILSVAAWIYKLLGENKALKESKAIGETLNRISQFTEQITGLDAKIKEEERDYEQKRNRAINGDPSDGTT